MTYTQSGLPNGGRTNYFEIRYDTSLSTVRGQNVASDLMRYCDDDYSWLNSFFPGTVIGWPGNIKINVEIKNSDIDTTDPRFLGAEWCGYAWSYTITVGFGERPIAGMSAVDALRWLIVIEVSEMFMRERQGYGPWNDWFSTVPPNEGSKGESLSQVFGVEFIRNRVIGATSTPGEAWSSMWLNDSNRPDFVSTAPPTNGRVPENGCGTLFLLFLRDQLGYALDQIVAHGGSTLADVYSHLTGDDANNAFPYFVNLVQDHYPSYDGPYYPPLETVFPVPNITGIYADVKLSWIMNGPPPKLLVAFDRAIVARTTVHLNSDHPNIIGVPPVIRNAPPGAGGFSALLQVKPQGHRFTQQDVTLTARYAGRTLSITVHVVRPENLLPPLKIEAISDGDRCRRLFEEGTPVTFYIGNIGVFSDQHGLIYTWAVKGAMANVLDTPQITIPVLPGAGTSVAVVVTVENSIGLRATGQLNFTVLHPLSAFAEADRQVRCRLSSMSWINAFIPPWVPIESGPLSLDQIDHLQRNLSVPLERIIKVQELLTQLKEGHQKIRNGVGHG